MILPHSLSSTYILNEKIVHLTSRNVLLLSNKHTHHKVIAYKFNSLSEIEKNEIRFLSLTNQYHPHLLSCSSIIEDTSICNNNIYYCIVEYADNNTLYHYILNNKKQNKIINEQTIWSFLIQMLYAVYTLHMNGIIHNNIKLSNFYMFNNNTTLKLGGYKLCEYATHKNAMKNLASSLNYFYASPELINNTSYDYNSDIFSIGVCVYEMCCMNDDYNQLEMYLNILQGKLTHINSTMYSKELFDIITMMLNIKKHQRPNVWELLQMKAITKHISDINTYIDALSYGKGYLDCININNNNNSASLNDVNVYVENFNKKRSKCSSSNSYQLMKNNSNDKSVCLNKRSNILKKNTSNNVNSSNSNNNIIMNDKLNLLQNEKHLIFKKINERKSHSRKRFSNKRNNNTFHLNCHTTTSSLFKSNTPINIHKVNCSYYLNTNSNYNN